MAGHTTHDQRDCSWQGGANLFKAGQPNNGILALRLDFMLPPRSFKAGFCMEFASDVQPGGRYYKTVVWERE